jgi:hypothetical protein
MTERWYEKAIIYCLDVEMFQDTRCPVQRGFRRIEFTVPTVHAATARCGLRSGSAADGHGTSVSLRARAIRATLCPARRSAKIHRTTWAVS